MPELAIICVLAFGAVWLNVRKKIPVFDTALALPASRV
jgi:hypothetical protein